VTESDPRPKPIRSKRSLWTILRKDVVAGLISASALAAAQAIAGHNPVQRDQALFLLVVLIGLFLSVFGLLRLGRLVRFVSSPG
jgi:MFS superfamily sulfate permease-like transporter